MSSWRPLQPMWVNCIALLQPRHTGERVRESGYKWGFGRRGGQGGPLILDQNSFDSLLHLHWVSFPNSATSHVQDFLF